MRTDDNRNPAAITTDIAKQAGLVLGTDYTQGAAFVSYAHTYYTARLLGDPVAQTIRVIDAIGYYTHAGAQRWTYIAIPAFVWADAVAGSEARRGGLSLPARRKRREHAQSISELRQAQNLNVVSIMTSA